MAFRCRPAAVTFGLVAIMVVLVLASLAASLLLWQTEHDNAFGFVPSFHVDREKSLPAYFSAALLALCCGLLTLIARTRPSPGATHWIVLACLFALMSVDEIVGMHERLIVPMRGLLDVQGPSVLHFAWVGPGLVVVALLGLYFVPFLHRLPPPTAARFVLAGAIYVGGAIGIEMLGGYYASSFPEYRIKATDVFFGYELIVTLEETMEMLGLIVFVHALLRYCARHVGEIHVAFDGGVASPGRTTRAT